jgi:hypothetical protein
MTVTSNVQNSTFPALSLARHVTPLVPKGKTVPEGGLHITVVPGQLSDAVTL